MKAQTGITARFEGKIYKIESSEVEGSKVTNLILAVPTTIDKKIKTVYAEISFWGKQSELVQEYTVGDFLWVQGLEECIPYLDSDNKPQIRYRMRIPYVWGAEKKSESPSYDYEMNSTQPEKSSNSNNDMTTEEKKALSFTLNSGKYKGMKIADVLIKDAAYIHSIASNNKVSEEMRKILVLAYNYYYRYVSKEQPSKNVTPQNNIHKVLNYTLNSGKYKGFKLAELLITDVKYVYQVASSDKTKSDVKTLFVTAYNLYYTSINYIFEDGKYKGQKIADVYKKDPEYIKSLADSNYSFGLAYDYYWKKSEIYNNKTGQKPNQIEGAKGKYRPESYDYSQVPDGDLPF